MQEIVFGIQHLEDFLTRIKCRKYLLVCDSAFPYLKIEDYINSIGLQYVVFSQFTPNPLYEDVCKGIEMFVKEGCDAIVAIGGGSTVDVAKCIKLFCKMNPNENFLQQEFLDCSVPLIAIPTTAGTGSESTRYAVIYYDGKKQSITHDTIIPNYAILEPQLLKTLPVYQKKCTMLDALCQGIESWWSVNSTEESVSYSKKAVSLIMNQWKSYIFENSDEAAEEIMLAANYAGKAICITQTTAAHAFSYKITSIYGLPHGHAVAICLPIIWEYMIEHLELCIDERGSDYLNNIFGNISKELGVATPCEAILLFKKLLQTLNIASPVSTNKNEDLEILTRSVNPIRLKNNPIKLEESEIRELYKQIIK